MASEIRVDKINSLSGVGTVTLSPTGVDIAGITTVATFKVGTGVTASSDGDIFATGVTTSTTFVGNLTGDVTGNVTGNISGGTVAGSTGTFTSHVSLGDSDQLRFGDSNDLVIQHNGTDSLISDTGTGDLYIRGSDDIFIQKGDGSETFIACNDDGSVDLYYNNDKKLATTSQGAAITNGSGIAALTVTGTGSNRSDVRILATGTADANLWLDASNGDLSGADYAVITHNNSTLDLEIISYANDVIIKTRNGTQGSGGLNNAIHCHENGAVDLYHDGTKQCETSASGLAFPSGKGIDFSATSDGSGTASSELLDDYEEGTWTITVNNGFSGISYSIQRGWYVKIGNLLHASFFLRFSAAGASTHMRFSGLPYVAANLSPAYSSGGNVTYTNIPGIDSSANVGNQSIWIGGNSSIFELYSNGNSSSATGSGGFSDKDIYGHLTYRTG